MSDQRAGAGVAPWRGFGRVFVRVGEADPALLEGGVGLVWRLVALFGLRVGYGSSLGFFGGGTMVENDDLGVFRVDGAGEDGCGGGGMFV